jgi:hypothetical protein
MEKFPVRCDPHRDVSKERCEANKGDSFILQYNEYEQLDPYKLYHQ